MSRDIFNDGDVLLAAEQQAVHDQGVITVASAAERDALPSSVKMCWLTGTLYKRSGGGTWEVMARTNDLIGLAPLTGEGTSGTWTINITGTAPTATNAGYASSAGNADTVDGQHASAFAGAGHGHNPSASGISVIYHNFGSLNAGASKSQWFGRSNDQYPVVSVSHSSTYILAVVASLTDGGYTVEVRNSTASTNHTNVAVIIHLVRAA